MYVAQKAKQELVSAAQSSLLYNFLYTRARRYPRTREAMLNWEAYSSFWYYSVERLPDIITKGIYPEKLPHLPRMLLRNCDLNGADCLDIGSMEGLVPALMCRQGARRVLACAVHGVLSGPALKRIEESPLEEVIITNSVPLTPGKASPKVHVLSVAPLLAEAIRRIHDEESVSTLFV